MTEFISRKYGNEGYEVIIKTDSHEHYKAAEDFARRLIDHAKPVATDNNNGCNRDCKNCWKTKLVTQQWIQVTERLPEHFGVFIVAIREPCMERVGRDCADFDPFAKTWLPSMCWANGYEVTHWMELPKPPKENGNG